MYSLSKVSGRFETGLHSHVHMNSYVTDSQEIWTNGVIALHRFAISLCLGQVSLQNRQYVQQTNLLSTLQLPQMYR